MYNSSNYEDKCKISTNAAIVLTALLITAFLVSIASGTNLPGEVLAVLSTSLVLNAALVSLDMNRRKSLIRALERQAAETGELKSEMEHMQAECSEATATKEKNAELEARNAALLSENMKLRAMPKVADPYYCERESVEVRIKNVHNDRYAWTSTPLRNMLSHDTLRVSAAGSGLFTIGIASLDKGEDTIVREIVEAEAINAWTYHFEAEADGDYIVYLKGAERAAARITIATRQVRSRTVH